MLLNAGPCPHCVNAASENIMEAVRKHGEQTNDLYVQEPMRLAMASPKRAVIRSHNTLKYKIGVQCTCCKHVYAEVDTDISSTDGSKGLGGQGESANRLRNLVASGRSAEAEVMRVFSLVGMGYWNSVRLGTLTAQRNVANAERARDDCCLVCFFEHTTATANSEIVRLDRLEEVACGSMGPMLRDIINGNWSNLSAELRSHLKDRGVSKLAHSIKGLQGNETEKGWVFWSDEPVVRDQHALRCRHRRSLECKQTE